MSSTNSPKSQRIRTQYDLDYNPDVFSTDGAGDPDVEYNALTQQQFVAECDINTIMKQYMRTGDLTHIYEAVGQYGDFSDVLDYREGIHQIWAAEASFMELPSDVRDRFDNDPAKFIDFATNPENLDEMRELKLAPALPPEPVAPITRKDLEEVLGAPAPKEK